MKYISSLTLVMTISFITNSSPIFLNVVLITQALIFAVMLGSIYAMYWFSYLLFLIMVGGVLILVSYVVSTLPMHKAKMNMNIFLILPIIFLMFLFVGINKIYPTSSFDTLQDNPLMAIDMFVSLISLYHTNTNMFNIFLVTFLFILLLAVEKISIHQLGLLRMK